MSKVRSVYVDLENHLAKWESTQRLSDPDPELKRLIENWMRSGFRVALMTYHALPRNGKRARVIQQWSFRHFGVELDLVYRESSFD